MWFDVMAVSTQTEYGSDFRRMSRSRAVAEGVSSPR